MNEDTITITIDRKKARRIAMGILAYKENMSSFVKHLGVQEAYEVSGHGPATIALAMVCQLDGVDSDQHIEETEDFVREVADLIDRGVVDGHMMAALRELGPKTNPEA